MIHQEQLLADLVAIRSDKSSQNNGAIEAGMVTYLKQFCASHLARFYVEEQIVNGDRMNLLVHDGTPMRLLLLGHMDTVFEGEGWTKSARGQSDGDRFYGRGSADMKAGLISILSALSYAHDRAISGVAALFYCDEEYDFLGMKAFLAAYGDRPKPELVLCPEPTNESLRAGVRGVFEFVCVIQGHTGHAAKQNGVSAFEGFRRGFERLEFMLAPLKDPELGMPTVNVAGITCGTMEIIQDGKGLSIKDIGNVIPNYCRARIEIRTVPSVSQEEVLEVFARGVQEAHTRVDSVDVVHDLSSFSTPRAQLLALEAAQRGILGCVRYQDPSEGGYSDIAMLAHHWKVPAALWGPAGGNTHGIDEYVALASMNRLSRGFQSLVDSYT